MSAMLRVYSESFDVNAYVSTSQFPVFRVFHRGEPYGVRHRSDAKKHERSGFNAVVSEADFDDFKGQVRDAIAFLKQHAEKVWRVVALAGSASIDFGIADREGAVVQSETFPAERVRLAAACNLALEFSRYPEIHAEVSDRAT